MINQYEVIRKLLAISRCILYTSFQMCQLSATIQEIHADLVTFSKYFKSVSCKCKCMSSKGACHGTKQNTKTKPYAASGLSQTLNHLFATGSCQCAMFMMYLPDVLSGKSLVLNWSSCGQITLGTAGRMESLSPVRSLACVHSKLKSAKSFMSLFMFPVHIQLREDRSSNLHYITICLITSAIPCILQGLRYLAEAFTGEESQHWHLLALL